MGWNLGRNDKCPCGSGLKYKDCCIARPPGRFPPEALKSKRLQLTDAEIEALVAPNAAAQALCQEVREFYGGSLTVWKIFTLAASSRYAILVDASAYQFHGVQISISSSSPSPTEAFVHELLHLRMGAEGFPLVRSLRNDPRLDMNDELNVFAEVKNSADHQVFFGDFLTMGFDRTKFLRDHHLNNHLRYEEHGRKYRNGEHDEAQLWKWFAVEYIAHHFAALHGLPARQSYADEAVRWGSFAIPAFAALPVEITKWVDDRSYSDPATYSRSIADLCGLVRLTGISSTYVISRTEGGKPRLLPLA